MSAHAATSHNSAATPALDETRETLLRTGDTIRHATCGTVMCCTDTMAAAVESGTETARLMEALGKGYANLCSEAATATLEIARQSLTCRTPGDVMALQSKGMDALQDAFDASAVLYNDIFVAYTKALEPLMLATGQAPGRVFQAIAD